MPFRLLTSRNGYEAGKYKALAALFDQMRRVSKKTIAICRESAHVATMSENMMTSCAETPVDDMTTRTRRETVHFRHPFRIKGIDRQLAPGAYEIITDEEMIEGLSFPCFRRVATMIMVPGAPPQRSAMEMISISSVDLSDAQRIDASAPRD